MAIKQSDDFQLFVLEQLEALPDIVCKRMFGGYGLYQAGIFFGIIHKGRVYFKTDDNTRKEYEKAGMQSFRPTEKMTLKTYYEVPVTVLEDRKLIRQWAAKAVKTARASSR